MFIELHIGGKTAIFNSEDIFAVIPAQKGSGSLICQSTDCFLQVDESVDAVYDILANTLEVEILANDE